MFSDKQLSVGEELVANTTDGAYEKHVPVVTVDGDTVTVKVGSVEHPSLPAHFIEFIVLKTTTDIHTKWLKPGNKPEAVFTINEAPIAAYEYCNLHDCGRWRCNYLFADRLVV